MATAREIIDEARDYHPSFSEQRHPPRTLLRRLSRAEQSLFVLVAGLEPELLARPYTVERDAVLDAVDGHMPVGLPSYLSVVSGRVFWRDVGGSQPLTLLDTIQALGAEPRFPSATPVAGGLVLTDRRDRGAMESGWDEIDRIEVRLVPAPIPLKGLDDRLLAPDTFTAALVGELVSFMALREGLDSTELASMAERERSALAAQAAAHGQAVTWHVEPAFG